MRSQRTRVKICGVRSAETALWAAEAGADAVGFMFHPSSARFIDPEDAAGIIADLPPLLTTVGVFVSASVDKFCDIEEACPTHLSQLHGDEDEETVRQCGPDVIKAVRYDKRTIAEEISRWCALDEVAAVLVDGSAGGQGTAFDWPALADYVRAASKPIIVAGGLTPANVGDAIRVLRPWAVDVSSGVEGSQGVKDRRMIEEFCAAVREADRR